MKAKYVNPFTDFGFKKIFGEEASKPLLLDFLNALLPPHAQIKNLSFKNTEHLGQTAADRKSVFDIYCEAESGEKFIVELQKAKQNFFKERTVYYSTFPIREQAEKGEWNYPLQAVFCSCNARAGIAGSGCCIAPRVRRHGAQRANQHRPGRHVQRDHQFRYPGSLWPAAPLSYIDEPASLEKL